MKQINMYISVVTYYMIIISPLMQIMEELESPLPPVISSIVIS